MWRRIKLIMGWISFVIVSGEAAFVVFGAVLVHAYDPSPEVQKLSGGGPLFSTMSGSGSGFFINSSGEVLTNRHGVKSCRRISIAGAGFHGVRAKVIASSSAFDRDLAIIQAPIKPPAIARFLDPQPAYDKSLDDLPGPFNVVGFPGSDRGATPVTQRMTTVKLQHTSGTEELLVVADGPNERGESGSPSSQAMVL